MASSKNSAIDIRLIFLLFWLPFSAADSETISELAGTRATESQLANISLLFYTGETLDEYTSVLLGDAINLLDQIDPERPTVFYIFGWTESPSAASAVAVVGAYLERQDHNVVLVNWEQIAAGLYVNAATSASSIGSAVADALNELVAAGLNSTTIHVVGHSLGAQIAGFVGRNVDFALPRITGLDPAGPGFYFLVEDLTASDAEFVDVIHTDGGVYGTISSKATVNFHPNGGIRFQAGCPLVRVPLSDDDFCDHHRSFYYYAESLVNEDAFTGVECSSYAAFRLRLCRSNSEVVMGYKTPTTASGDIYLQTNSEAPYGKGVDDLRGEHLVTCGKSSDNLYTPEFIIDVKLANVMLTRRFFHPENPVR